MKQFLFAIGILVAMGSAAWADSHTMAPKDAQSAIASTGEQPFAQQMALATQGSVEAQFNVARALSEGKGTEQNPKVAAGWFKKAAEQGHVLAQYRLGQIFERGQKGTRRDLSEAAEWYQRAAQGGNIDAQWKLSRFYETGRGLKVDVVEAYKWGSVALTRAGRDSDLFRKGSPRIHQLRWRMPPEQFGKAEQWVINWQPRKG
jgi:TPR repeat protein